MIFLGSGKGAVNFIQWKGKMTPMYTEIPWRNNDIKYIFCPHQENGNNDQKHYSGPMNLICDVF